MAKLSEKNRKKILRRKRTNKKKQNGWRKNSMKEANISGKRQQIKRKDKKRPQVSEQENKQIQINNEKYVNGKLERDCDLKYFD